jgi:hypothetical protein
MTLNKFAYKKTRGIGRIRTRTTCNFLIICIIQALVWNVYEYHFSPFLTETYMTIHKHIKTHKTRRPIYYFVTLIR